MGDPMETPALSYEALEGWVQGFSLAQLDTLVFRLSTRLPERSTTCQQVFQGLKSGRISIEDCFAFCPGLPKPPQHSPDSDEASEISVDEPACPDRDWTAPVQLPSLSSRLEAHSVPAPSELFA